MHKLHPGARWVFRVNAFMAMIPLIVILSVVFVNRLVMKQMVSSISDAGGTVVGSVPSVGWLPYMIGGLFLLMIIVAEIYARLAYVNWGFEFADDSLKLERGIIWKKYSNIPYDRVQNVDIQRGILARLLGFSTLDVQTAGAAYSNRGALRSEGHVPAVDRAYADKVREFLIKKISKKSSGGL